MEEYKTKRIRYVEVAKDIYAAITPADGLDITDAGMMDNFSNSAYINRGEGLVSDTFFDLPHARDLREFCVKKSGHAPKASRGSSFQVNSGQRTARDRTFFTE